MQQRRRTRRTNSFSSHLRLVSKRNIQGPKGRRAARNPLKSLAARSDISSEYTELKTGIAERELRRLKLESCKADLFLTEAPN